MARLLFKKNSLLCILLIGVMPCLAMEGIFPKRKSGGEEKQPQRSSLVPAKPSLQKIPSFETTPELKPKLREQSPTIKEQSHIQTTAQGPQIGVVIKRIINDSNEKWIIENTKSVLVEGQTPTTAHRFFYPLAPGETFNEEIPLYFDDKTKKMDSVTIVSQDDLKQKKRPDMVFLEGKIITAHEPGGTISVTITPSMDIQKISEGMAVEGTQPVTQKTFATFKVQQYSKVQINQIANYTNKPLTIKSTGIETISLQPGHVIELPLAILRGQRGWQPLIFQTEERGARLTVFVPRNELAITSTIPEFNPKEKSINLEVTQNKDGSLNISTTEKPLVRKKQLSEYFIRRD